MIGHGLTPQDVPDEDPPPPLAEWLLARLDEDQEAAERAQPGPWVTIPAAMPGEIEVRHQMPDGRPDATVAVATTHGLYCAGGDAEYIARHNPGRALAEVAAKRLIIAEYQAHVRAVGEGLSVPLGRVMRALALPYAEHPTYRAEYWTP